jgi:hypothetical protein
MAITRIGVTALGAMLALAATGIARGESSLAADSAIEPASTAQLDASENHTSSAGLATDRPQESDLGAGDGVAELTPGRRLYEQEKYKGAADHPTSWAVMAYKSRQELVVYYKSRLFKTYDAVFGRNLDRRIKVFEGDRRTPEGAYRIVSKEPSQRFTRFLRIDYPNALDRLRYRESKAAGEVPNQGGRLPGEGGLIGIHGTDDPRLNETRVNWTAGCISLHNHDVIELDELLPVGTSVVIKP